jgi:hypothetical protein
VHGASILWGIRHEGMGFNGRVIVDHVVVRHVFMDRVVGVDVGDVHGPVDDRLVDCYVVICIVYIPGIIDLNVLDTALPPASASPASPTVVVNTTPGPIAVAAQPSPDHEPGAKADHGAHRHCFSVGPDINDQRIVRRYIDVLRVRGYDLNVPTLVDDLLLRGRIQIAPHARHAAQALDGLHHISGLVHISLTDGGGPVDALAHHVDDHRVVCNAFNADVPILIVDPVCTI